MRFTFRAFAMLSLSCSLFACGGEDTTAQIAWKLSCSAGNQVACSGYVLHQFPNEDDIKADFFCSIEAKDGGAAEVNFSVTQEDAFSLSMSNALVANGSVSNSGCEVAAYENNEVGEDTYYAPCGTNNQPCIIDNLSIEGSTLSGSLQCTALMSRLDDASLRDLGGTGSGGPVNFEFQNCQ
jgi:hypothetical protein